MTESWDGAEATVPARLVLAVGDRHSIRLPGLASAGYQWSVVVVGRQPEDRSVVSTQLTVLDDRTGSDGSGATSYSLPVEATIVALEPGQAVVRLIQARSWRIETPRRRHDIEVTVNRPGAQ